MATRRNRRNKTDFTEVLAMVWCVVAGAAIVAVLVAGAVLNLTQAI